MSSQEKVAKWLRKRDGEMLVNPAARDHVTHEEEAAELLALIQPGEPVGWLVDTLYRGKLRQRIWVDSKNTDSVEAWKRVKAQPGEDVTYQIHEAYLAPPKPEREAMELRMNLALCKDDLERYKEEVVNLCAELNKKDAILSGGNDG